MQADLHACCFSVALKDIGNGIDIGGVVAVGQGEGQILAVLFTNAVAVGINIAVFFQQGLGAFYVKGREGDVGCDQVFENG